MLSAAITILFTVAALVASGVIVHSLRAAHAAWLRLEREGAVLRAGLAVQAAATPMRLRPRPAPLAARRSVARQRTAGLPPLPACAA
jgi:hypothetical protein